MLFCIDLELYHDATILVTLSTLPKSPEDCPVLGMSLHWTVHYVEIPVIDRRNQSSYISSPRGQSTTYGG